MTGIKFKSKEHEYFYYSMLDKSGSTDSYHRGGVLCDGYCA